MILSHIRIELDEFRVYDEALSQEEIAAIMAGPDVGGLLGDFDDNGVLNTIDIDLLMNEVAAGSNDAAFDLTKDGEVNDLDRDQWLAEAGPRNGFAGPFLVGDADLDGTVAAGDLNELGLTWSSDNNNCPMATSLAAAPMRPTLTPWL